MQHGIAHRDFRVGGPQRDTAVVEIIEDKLAERLRVQHVEHLEAVGLPPNDLLLAEAQECVTHLKINKSLAQFHIHVAANKQPLRRGRAIALLWYARLQLVDQVAAQPADHGELHRVAQGHTELGGQHKLRFLGFTAPPGQFSLEQARQFAVIEAPLGPGQVAARHQQAAQQGGGHDFRCGCCTHNRA